MTDVDYTQWKLEAETLCTEAGIPVPSEHILETMYDDGLEADEILNENIRGRYDRNSSRPVAHSVSDYLKLQFPNLD